MVSGSVSPLASVEAQGNRSCEAMGFAAGHRLIISAASCHAALLIPIMPIALGDPCLDWLFLPAPV